MTYPKYEWNGVLPEIGNANKSSRMLGFYRYGDDTSRNESSYFKIDV